MTGCQYDPYHRLYTAREPNDGDIAGMYILDHYCLPQGIRIEHRDIVVDLHSDGTFTAANIPPRQTDIPDTSFFSSLVTGTGRWETSTIGSDTIWGVCLRSPDTSLSTARLTGTKAPYGLIFTLGDPDCGYAVILKRKQ
ncbi:MAG: hypothetical protein KDA89_08755 [Planctomycetaceae bacterium]|nr:hypothetical protein [Planctomycetaceae bacterium]